LEGCTAVDPSPDRGGYFRSKVDTLISAHLAASVLHRQKYRGDRSALLEKLPFLGSKTAFSAGRRMAVDHCYGVTEGGKACLLQARNPPWIARQKRPAQ